MPVALSDTINYDKCSVVIISLLTHNVHVIAVSFGWYPVNCIPASACCTGEQHSFTTV